MTSDVYKDYIGMMNALWSLPAKPLKMSPDRELLAVVVQALRESSLPRERIAEIIEAHLRQ